MTNARIRSLGFISMSAKALLIMGALLPGCGSGGSDSDDDGNGGSSTHGEGGDSSGDGAGPVIGSGGSTGSGGPSCTGDEVTCLDGSTVGACENGELTPYACTDVCDYLGFYSDGCAQDSCSCGDPNDSTCLDGVGGFCFCLEDAGAGTCSDDDYSNMYGGCHQGDPDFDVIACYASYVSGNSIDCAAAANGCL